MSQSESNSEVVSWFIDRTPDYDIQSSQDTIVEEMFGYSDYVEATDYLADYTPFTRRRPDDINNDIDYNNYEPNEDFIPFGNPAGRNRINNSPVNFIVNEFDLSEEDRTCCVCIDEKNSEQICKLNCCHVFCVECINNCLERNSLCPLCRSYITQIRTQTFEARDKIKH
jgi:hypothetical protein